MDGLGMISDPNVGMEAGFGNVLMNRSLFASGMSPALHESQSMLDFKNTSGSRTPMLEQLGFEIGLTANESDDDSTATAGEKLHNGGSRKRLTVHQVHCLEKCFKVDSMLEPRRKTELAKELGLKPRQVVIWFQNRRARHKNKQIEKDYDKVAGQYSMIKAQYDKVINENMKLKAQMKSMQDEMSLMKDSLLNYGKLMKGGLSDSQMMQTQPQVMQEQAEPVLMQQTQPELQQAYNDHTEFNIMCNGGMVEQQQVISPASSVFDSNRPAVTPKSKLLTPMEIPHPVAVEPADKRSTNFMQGEQEKSVNQELPYDLPNLFDLDEQNCFYSSQVDGPPISLCDFGVIPAADDPFWQFEL